MKPLSATCLVLVLFCTGALALPAGRDNLSDSAKATLARLSAIVTAPILEWRYHADLPHPEDPAIDDSDWPVMKVRPGENREDEQTHWKGPRVFRAWVQIPENIHGYATNHAAVKLDLDFDSDARMILTVFSNGSVLFHGEQELQQPMLLAANAQPGEKYLIAVRVDAADVDTALFRSQLLIEPQAGRPNPAFLHDELLAAQLLIGAYADGKSQREQILDAAIKAVDFRRLDAGDQAGFDASLRQAHADLEALKPWLHRFVIRAVGNSHIDMAWLWPWTETVEVVRNTFRSVLDLMREYPDFKFTMSSAQAYQWMEEKYPDLFQEIQQRVKEGRWEIIGGMWVEPDLNMPAGESLVRQILVGKRYFRQKFGVDVKIGWNPDSFGYNWQLPQIYKRSGIDYFVTQKLLWAHEFTTFPYKLFWWESPDGSRILTYFPHDYAGGLEADRLASDLAVWMPSIYGPTLNDTPEMMHLYGVGDHGGGPTRTMLDNAVRLSSPTAIFPRLEMSTASAFFDDLNQKLANMEVPTWDDELYFQYHRGVFTTQAETKRRIRRSEEAVLNAEKFSSLALLFGRAYPQQELESAWKKLLFDHFHDIMPGSGIAVNYLDAQRNLREVRRMSGEMMDGAVQEISAQADTSGDGVPVMVFNPLSWAHTEVIEIRVQLPGPAKMVAVMNSQGKRVPSQLLHLDSATHRADLLLMAQVPSLGYRTYFVRAASQAQSAASGVKAADGVLENEFVRLKIDTRSGCMTSLFDKRSHTEALAPAETDSGGPKDRVCGNLLQAFHDLPKQWDAWNIDADFEKQHWDLDQADEVKLIERGPLRAVIRVTNHFQSSRFVRDITIYAGVPRVDVNMRADWHEQHILLKVAFPLSAHNVKASYEIPFGSIERPTTRNTAAEKAEFEVPAEHWADISDRTHGFSLLNNCKYGYDGKGNVLRLSLLRSPTWPDPHADQGEHEFTYSLYPHGGNWRDAQTVRRGYELNHSLIAWLTQNHQGSLPPQHSFLEVRPENVVVTAVKKAEDADGLIIRFYEWAGRESDVSLRLPPGAEKASETDLMEKPTAPLTLRDGSAIVHTKPYEIKTVYVEFGRARAAANGQPH